MLLPLIQQRHLFMPKLLIIAGFASNVLLNLSQPSFL